MIYLDNAATTLVKPASVERSFVQAMRTMASPGRGGHEPAMRAAETVLDCRMEAAELFNAPEPEQIVFTMNATHALNIAIRSLIRRGERVVVSGFEHNAVTRTLQACGARVCVAGRRLFDPADTIEAFQKALPDADFAICTHVSNVFGYALPIYEIADLCREHGVPLIVDASQSAGILTVDVQRLGAAFTAMPGHKALFGPQGTGILICGETGEPLLHGGSGSESILQEMPAFLPDRHEAGTQNVCGIAGLLAGIRFVKEKGTEAILSHERRLLADARRELTGCGLQLFTGSEQTQCGVLSLRSERHDCEWIAQRLAERGICVRSGLHCAPTAHESAGTLQSGTVRLSFSPFVTAEQVKGACAALREIADQA
ncbi:MAG: aminotransferase class V-fold PLP-dependent enzyme [Oscillospiraceae bacterium]|nr:aminotransferase class V-fold PLP-dependent enzyme [Oscillospiraceae bacterium]